AAAAGPGGAAATGGHTRGRRPRAADNAGGGAAGAGPRGGAPPPPGARARPASSGLGRLPAGTPEDGQEERGAEAAGERRDREARPAGQLAGDPERPVEGDRAAAERAERARHHDDHEDVLVALPGTEDEEPVAQVGDDERHRHRPDRP